MTDNLLSLITTAVDGELNPAEILRFNQLLDSSPEARGLYDQLRSDSNRLRNFPFVPPPSDLRAKVMAQIAAVTPRPIVAQASALGQHSTVEPSTQLQPRSHVRSRRLVPIAIAASLLFTVTGSSFWFFSGNAGKTGAVAQSSNRPAASKSSRAGDSGWAQSLPPENASHPIAPTVTPGMVSGTEPRTELIVPPSGAVPQGPVETIAVAPAPHTPHNPNFYAAEPRPEIPPLDLVRVRVPFLKQLADFDHDETRQQFVEELGKDPAFRIDVFTRQLPRSVEWFRNAASAANVNLFVDATTLERVNAAQINSVVVYIESLTASELANLLAKVSAEDAKISPRMFDALHATPVHEDDQRAIRSILGIDPGLFKRPGQEKTIEQPKPISSGTVDQIVKSLNSSGQGKEPEKPAVLMTWSPGAGRTIPSASAELKQFLTKRGERKANAVPVLIVIRPGNG